MNASPLSNGPSQIRIWLSALLTVFFAALGFVALPPFGDQRDQFKAGRSSVAKGLGWTLRWNMFSPEVPKTNSFLFAEVRKRDGSCEVAVSPMAWRIAPLEASLNDQWGKFLQEGYLRLGHGEGLAYFVEGLVGELQRAIPEALSVRILFAVNPIPPPFVDGDGRTLNRRAFIPHESNHITDVSLIVKKWRDGSPH